jgi:hypothetical protein
VLTLADAPAAIDLPIDHDEEIAVSEPGYDPQRDPTTDPNFIRQPRGRRTRLRRKGGPGWG